MQIAYWTTVCLSLLLGVTSAVERVCCADAVFRLTIDLAQTCLDSNVGNYGIAIAMCMFSIVPPFEATGMLLETVTKVDILELDTHFGILARQEVPQSLVDGAVVEYHSMVSQGGPSPSFLQVGVTAATTNGDSVMNWWVVKFEDSCIVPVLPQGSSVGLTGLEIVCNELTAGSYEKEDGEVSGLPGAPGRNGKGKMSRNNRR